MGFRAQGSLQAHEKDCWCTRSYALVQEILSEAGARAVEDRWDAGFSNCLETVSLVFFKGSGFRV